MAHTPETAAAFLLAHIPSFPSLEADIVAYAAQKGADLPQHACATFLVLAFRQMMTNPVTAPAARCLLDTLLSQEGLKTFTTMMDTQARRKAARPAHKVTGVAGLFHLLTALKETIDV